MRIKRKLFNKQGLGIGGECYIYAFTAKVKGDIYATFPGPKKLFKQVKF